MTENKFKLRFSEKIQEAIAKLVVQYSLKIDLNLDLSERLKRPDPELVIFKLAKRMVNKEGQFKDISEILKKDLGMSQEKADALAQDIKNQIVPLTDIIELEEPKRVPAPVAPPAPKLPYGKKIEIPDVEENAALMPEKEMQKARTVLPQTERKPDTGVPDPYKEALE